MKKHKKILIIKTGFSEFLDRGVSTVVSLGDVLFCTTLLHLYKDDEVTWVVSAAAKELLENNPCIKRLVVFGSKALGPIMRKHYDIFINLEKDIGICAFLQDVKAKKKYGFYFNDQSQDIAVYRSPTRLLLAGQENHHKMTGNTAQILCRAVEKSWTGRGPILRPRKRSKEIYDIGLNYAVGSKWPTKGWPMRNWKDLECRLKKDFKISWQQGHKNLHQYIRWIDSCRMIVTSDSLGQIIAQALGKPAVTLFGPTNHKRMAGVPGTHIVLSPSVCPCRPCFLPVCQYKKPCMEEILPKTVEQYCRRLYKELYG